MGTFPIRYLGLPLSTGQLRGADLQSVVGKVEQRLEGWKAKVLSKGGRLVFPKSVLLAIPTFYLSVFKIPASIEQHLSGLMRRFFWKGSKEGRGLALVAWDNICKPTTYFKMDKSWLRERGFKEEIMEVWRSYAREETGSKKLTGCIGRVRGYLMQYRRRIRETRCKVRVEALAKIKELDDVEDSRGLTAGEVQQRRKWRFVVATEDRKEEMDWRQRSRQLWLKERDANTRFFHLVANGRRRTNQILRLRVGSQQHSVPQAMGRALAEHFWAMTRRGGPSRWRWAGRGASQLTTDQRALLVRPFMKEEVQFAIAGLNGEGAPGPDGLLVLFYKEFWAVVKGDVMATLEELRSPQANMERINKSYLFMLPKRQGAENVSDYRPIALSNSIYLIVAKVLANRLKEVIGKFIGPFQYAFIPGRQLSDSAVMAGEILAAWKAQGTKGFMWKVDFAKAYDSLDWRFLWAVLRKRGFPEEWIKWMKRCVTSQSFSVLLNGRPAGGWIRPQRGIRQGCPLAPMLFVLAADVLYMSAAHSCARGNLKGFQTPSQPSGIPLLQYADDTVFFMEGSVEEAKNLSALLDVFAYCSGLRLNRGKSEFTGFGLSQDEESQCSQALGTPVGALPCRYLGLPLSAGRLRVADWQPVVGKVEQRLEGWKAKILSKGGRLVLLRSVLSAIPTFYLSVFRIPASIEQRLSGIMRKFFWKGSTEGRGLALVA